METSILKVKRSNKFYKIYEGTYYSVECTDKLIKTLHQIQVDKIRIKLCYGDLKTGQDWKEEFDVLGTIGRSTGSIKIPLLIHNTRAFGGGAIPTDCIVKISYANKKQGLKPLYQVKNYHL